MDVDMPRRCRHSGIYEAYPHPCCNIIQVVISPESTVEESLMDSLAIPAQSHMIDLPAGRFHYLSWGAERTDLPALLLLHGITSSAPSWGRVAPALADRYRVYALDMRGHGDSVMLPSGVYSLRHSADDAA